LPIGIFQENVQSTILFDWSYRRQLIFKLLKEIDADIVCLQEVELADIPPHDYPFSHSHHITKKRTSPFGNLTLSKYPLTPIKETTHSLVTLIDDRFIIVNTHLTVGDSIEKKREQLEKLMIHSPLVIAGDFNDEMEDPRYSCQHIQTYKNHCMDYIWIEKSLPVVYKSKRYGNIPSEQCPSDHIPVLAIVKDL
jgi:endonuclease/exonuclease/phosphatase family metal-dependent hydrolase